MFARWLKNVTCIDSCFGRNTKEKHENNGHQIKDNNSQRTRLELGIARMWLQGKSRRGGREPVIQTDLNTCVLWRKPSPSSPHPRDYDYENGNPLRGVGGEF